MSCFLFLSNFVVQYSSTVGMVLSAIICGHSCCKRLQVDMQAGTDARMRPSFKLEGTARVRMLGKGGKTIGDFVRRDIPVILRYRPDILILLLGDNDTGAEDIANHLITLASQLYMGDHVSRIVLCQMMPRSRASQAVQRRMGGVTRRNADRYLLLHGQQAQENNKQTNNCPARKSFRLSSMPAASTECFVDTMLVADGQLPRGFCCCCSFF